MSDPKGNKELAFIFKILLNFLINKARKNAKKTEKMKIFDLLNWEILKRKNTL